LKILITGAKTATALKITKAFNQFEILLGDYGDLPRITTNTYTFAELGVWNKDVLAHNLLTKCLDYGVDMLLPLYEAEVVAVAKSLVLFEEFNIDVLLTDGFEIEHVSAKNWAIFHKGDLVFSTTEVLLDPNLQSALNGAYYVNSDGLPHATITIADPS